MPPAVCPELAPPFTLRTTVTRDGVAFSSSATSGMRRPLPSSPRDIPTSAISWLEKGVKDMKSGVQPTSSGTPVAGEEKPQGRG